MKKLLSLLLLALLGAGLGGAGGWAVLRFLPAPSASAHVPDVRYVTAPVLVLPVVTREGGLSGYIQLTYQIETDATHEAAIAADMPRFLDAVNRAAWRKPSASGPDMLLPDPAALGQLGTTAARTAFRRKGGARVTRVLASEIRPL